MTTATTKLVQTQFLRGSREFEITDSTVSFRVKTVFKEKESLVDLSMLNPAPVINKPFLEFHGRVKAGPILSLLIDKPSKREFTDFVDVLKQRARQEYNAFAGLKDGGLPEGMAANRFDEPPDFDDPSPQQAGNNSKPVRVDSIDESIRMLEQHLDTEEIEPLLVALKVLREEPDNPARFGQLVNAFESLGPQQGAVLTYAPYVIILLSDDPFG